MAGKKPTYDELQDENEDLMDENEELRSKLDEIQGVLDEEEEDDEGKDTELKANIEGQNYSASISQD